MTIAGNEMVEHKITLPLRIVILRQDNCHCSFVFTTFPT